MRQNVMNKALAVMLDNTTQEDPGDMMAQMEDSGNLAEASQKVFRSGHDD